MNHINDDKKNDTDYCNDMIQHTDIYLIAEKSYLMIAHRCE